MLAVALAFTSSLCWGLADFLGGLQARRRPLVTVLLIAQVAAVALGIAFVLGSGDPFPDLGPAALATGAGVAGCAALAAFYRGLAIGTMSIVAPVSATGAAVPVLVGLAEGERPGALQVAGIAIAMLGIVLAAREPGGAEPSRAVRTSLLLAGLAALGFGSFFVLIDRATELGGAPWSLLLVRVGEVALLGTVALITRPRMPSGVRDASPLLVIGGLGTAAFATMQTSLVLTETPPAATSRVMGLVTMCIGTGPLGVLAIGLLADQIGAAPAILVMAGIGILGLSWTWFRLGRSPL